MPMYEYECHNPNCPNEEFPREKPHEFTELMKLKDIDKMPNCPLCRTNEFVKKVIRSAFPVSHSWSP
jgi:hypothetical protein